MAEPVKKVTVNIPLRLLEQARETTGLGITETLIAGLEEIARRQKRSALRRLRGSIAFHLDLPETRR